MDYVTRTPQQRSTTKLDVGGISLRGEPFTLPAGDVSVAFGVEALAVFLALTGVVILALVTIRKALEKAGSDH